MKSKTKNMKSSDRKSADRKSSDRKSSDTDDCNDNAKLEHKANTHFSQTKKALISYAKQGKGNKKLIQTLTYGKDAQHRMRGENTPYGRIRLRALYWCVDQNSRCCMWHRTLQHITTTIPLGNAIFNMRYSGLAVSTNATQKEQILIDSMHGVIDRNDVRICIKLDGSIVDCFKLRIRTFEMLLKDITPDYATKSPHIIQYGEHAKWKLNDNNIDAMFAFQRFGDPIEDRLFVTGVGLDKDMQKMIYLHEDYLYGTALELRTRNDQTIPPGFGIYLYVNDVAYPLY
eukprot:89258_1